ncbi:MAG: hypothetical protein M3R35_01355 [Candidatus Eremiobacteraeota bacterium]|nr:hypothetical protein [Candidatus Eremiobacteraeota bacterium]
MPNNSPSVLIVRLDAIGDALALTPLVAALRAAGCGLGIVLREGNAATFASRAFDCVHVPADGSQIAAERYTHALIATENAAGYRIALASGAPVRIGFENTRGKPLKALWARRLCTQTVKRTAGLDPRAPHEAQVLFELGRSLVPPNESPTRDSSILSRFVLDEEPSPDGRIAMQITDKWERLGASLDAVSELAALLNCHGNVRFIGAERESEYVNRFSERSGLRVERFIDVAPWKAAIAASRALVAPDSGATHVAGMTGVPTVAAFPTRDFALQTARWAPWAAPSRVVRIEDSWPSVVVESLNELLLGTLPSDTT